MMNRKARLIAHGRAQLKIVRQTIERGENPIIHFSVFEQDVAELAILLGASKEESLLMMDTDLTEKALEELRVEGHIVGARGLLKMIRRCISEGKPPHLPVKVFLDFTDSISRLVSKNLAEVLNDVEPGLTEKELAEYGSEEALITTARDLLRTIRGYASKGRTPSKYFFLFEATVMELRDFGGMDTRAQLLEAIEPGLIDAEIKILERTSHDSFGIEKPKEAVTLN